MIGEPSLGLKRPELRRLLRRAETMADKAADLFVLADELLPDDENRLRPLFGDAMTSTDQLRNMLKGAAGR